MTMENVPPKCTRASDNTFFRLNRSNMTRVQTLPICDSQSSGRGVYGVMSYTIQEISAWHLQRRVKLATELPK